MLSVAAALYSRINGDTTLQSLLGGTGRIYRADQMKIPGGGGMIGYRQIAATPGSIDGDVARQNVEIYAVSVFSNRLPEIERRLILLLDQYQHADASDAGHILSVWDGTGPELFDEEMQVSRADVMFRFYVVPKAVAPI